MTDITEWIFMFAESFSSYTSDKICHLTEKHLTCWMKSFLFLMFEAVYHLLLQMSILSDCETCIIWSFATDNQILDFISHCDCWFHSWIFKNWFRSRCSNNNHLQVLQEDEIHFWQRDMNCCWVSKSLFCQHHRLKHSDYMNQK